MRLTLPESDFTPGSKGFEDKDDKGQPIDWLGWKATGQKLSILVEMLESPTVIALDGSWGSGKSLFLKLWAGQHKIDYPNSTEVIYFDAFEHDFLDDPLASLITRLSEKSEKPGRMKNLQKAGIKLLKPAGRIGIAAATGGVSEFAGIVGDAVLDKTSAELEKLSDQFWAKETSRLAAMQEFRDALKALTTDENGTPRKIVIIIDELDRCRPDYALLMLEVMKHFFAVDNVHFVLGVNLKELENSVKARYGLGIDAARYLQKFTSVRFILPVSLGGFRNNISIHHYDRIASVFGTSEDWMHIRVRKLLELIPRQHQPSLRDIERIVASLVICSDVQLQHEFELTALAMLTILQVTRPDLLDLTLRNEAGTKSLCDYFGISESDKGRLESDISGKAYWVCLLTQEPDIRLSEKYDNYFKVISLDAHNIPNRSSILQNIYDKTLAEFRLPD